MRVVKVVREGVEGGEGVGGRRGWWGYLVRAAALLAGIGVRPRLTTYDHSRSTNGMPFIYFQEHLHITRFI